MSRDQFWLTKAQFSKIKQAISSERWTSAASLGLRGKGVSEMIPLLRRALARRSAPNVPQQAAGKQRADAAYAPQDRVHDRHIRPALGRMFRGNSESNRDDAARKWPFQAVRHDPNRVQPERLERFRRRARRRGPVADR